MIKIFPKIFGCNNCGNDSVHRDFSMKMQASTPVSDTFASQVKGNAAPDWVKNPVIVKAFAHLRNLDFDMNDVRHIEAMGLNLPFEKPKDAVKFIYVNNIRIMFAKMESPNIHAQYNYDSNFIEINEMYENTKNPAEILAISEAILHEVGHAKDKDGESSIQEELECLAMNALSHRIFTKKYPDIFKDVDSLIVKDGVCVYSELFFDKNGDYQGLVGRLKSKYNDLQAGDLVHPASELALRVKS